MSVQNAQERHPFVAGNHRASSRGLNRIGPAGLPRDVRLRLTPAQLERLLQPEARPPTEHPVAYRASTQLFGRRIYLAIFAGLEQRTHERVAREGQQRSVADVLFTLTIAGFLVSMALAVVALAGAGAIYLLKSSVGVDLSYSFAESHRAFFD